MSSSTNTFTTSFSHVDDQDNASTGTIIGTYTGNTCTSSTSISDCSLQSTENRTIGTCTGTGTGTGTTHTMKRSLVEIDNTSATATTTTDTDTDTVASSCKYNKLVSRKRLRTTSNNDSHRHEESWSDSSDAYSKNDCGSDSYNASETIILREVAHEDGADAYSRISDDVQQRLPLPNESNYDPDDYLIMLLNVLCPHIQLQVKSTNELNHYFPTPTEQQMQSYSTEIVNVVRLNNTSAMKEYYNQHGRDVFNCCNRFGENLLNMACRRGFIEIVQFLLSPDVQLSVRTRDDGGRTPLHDACWNPDPQIDICTWILQKDPSLFLVADKRGYTPFQYARKSDWHIWCEFLYSNYKSLYTMMKPEIANTFQKK
jgi:hypothetical protein